MWGGVSIYVEKRYLRPHFYSYPLMPSMTEAGVLGVLQRSVAATLYEKVDLNKPTVEFLCEHFYKDPTLALAYFIVVQQILVWQHSMTNCNQTLINQSYGIAFQT